MNDAEGVVTRSSLHAGVVSGAAAAAAVVAVALAGGGHGGVALGGRDRGGVGRTPSRDPLGAPSRERSGSGLSTAAAFLTALLALTALSTIWTTSTGAAFEQTVRTAGYLGAP